MIELCDCQNVLLREIAMKRLRQKDVALTYAMALASSESKDRIDWGVVNRAIVARWSAGGLNRIKNKAWKFLKALELGRLG